MQHPPKVEHYKSDIEDQEYQIKRYQRFNLKPNRENVGSVSKSREADLATKTDLRELRYQLIISFGTMLTVAVVILAALIQLG